MRTALALAVLMLAVAATPAAAQGGRCPDGFDCSTLTVPLDRSAAVPGTIGLQVARHRASAGPGKPALIELAGGPAQAAVPFAADAAQQFAVALDRYQLVMFDQRGTGGSGALSCPTLQRIGEFDDLDSTQRATAACGAVLGPRAGAYATAASVADIEAVRRAVGAPTVALIGTSYGTHVIQRYLLAHPDRVDRIVLNSTMAPGGSDGFGLETLGAANRVLDDLQQGASRAMGQLVERVARRPIRGTYYDDRGRRRRTTMRDASALYNLLVAGDENPLARIHLPAAIKAALDGDTAPLARLTGGDAGESTPPIEAQSSGLYAATSCADIRHPWAPASAPATRRPAYDAAIAGLEPARLAPFDRTVVRDTAPSGSCLGWPPIATQPDTIPGAYPRVPALILAGLADMRTPVENARAVAGLLGGAALVPVAGTGHDVIDADQTGCAKEALSRFFGGRDVGNPCEGKSNTLSNPAPDYPRRLADVKPVDDSVRGRRGRILSAALMTATDAQTAGVSAIQQSQGAPVRTGGLRGGTLRTSPGPGGRGIRFSLRRYEYLRRLAVSGAITVAEQQRGTLRLSGMARGRLRVAGRRIRGTIDGRRVALTLSPSPTEG